MAENKQKCLKERKLLKITEYDRKCLKITKVNKNDRKTYEN